MKLKRALSFILCALLLACLAPTTAFAAEGANPQSAGGVYASIVLSGAADKVLFSADGAIESRILSADELSEARYRPIPSASYDAASNTLTLSDFAGEGVVLELTMMGADFRLRLVGSSTLKAIRAESLGYGCSVCVCGDGSLTVSNPDGTAIWLDASGAADFVRVEAQAKLTASSGQGGAIRVVNSPLGADAIQFDTVSPDVSAWDSAAPLTERYTSSGAAIDVCTRSGFEGIFGLEAVLDEASESIVYNIYSLGGTDAAGGYYAELIEQNVADISAYSRVWSQHDVTLYEYGAGAPAPCVRFARFALRAFGSDEKGSVSISPSAVGRGGSATVSVLPAEGCKLKSLTINGREVQPTDGVYMIGCVTEDITAQAVFSGAAPAAIRVTAPALTDYTVPADGAPVFVSELFRAVVTDSGGDAVDIPIDWSIGPYTAGVTIGADGRARVTNEAKHAIDDPIRYTVTATAHGTQLSDSVSFTVSRAARAPYAVKLLRADVPVEDGDTLTIPAAGETETEYRAVVVDPYGEVLDVPVVWSASDWPLGVQRRDNRILVADNCADGSTLTLMAAAQSDGTVASRITIRFAAARTVVTAQSEEEIASASAAGKALTTDMITLAYAQTEYDGESKTPSVTLKDGETTLNEDTDYELSYDDNTEPGVATVTITGKGGYSGTITKTFRITRPITAATVTVSPEKLLHTGAVLTPEVVVTDGETVLVRDTDYELSYDDNTEPGTARVTVTGKGGYTGSSTKPFEIAAVTWPTVNEAAGKPFGTKLRDIVTLSGGSVTLDGVEVEGAFDFEDGDMIPPRRDGEFAIVFLSADGKLQGKKSGLKLNSELEPKPLTADTISVTVIPAELPWTGAAQTPAVQVKDGGTTLTADVDYTLAYADNTAISTAESKASVTVTGRGNYSGTRTASFMITRTPAASLAAGVLITPCKPEDSGTAPKLKIMYGGSELKQDTDYTVKYSYDVDKKTGTAEITFKGAYQGTLEQEFNLPNYLIVEGAGGSWSKSSADALSFTANGAKGKFTKLTVDGAVVDQKYYSVVSGSTIVKISTDYLKTLSAAKHIVGIYYKDGKALAIFTVTAAARRGVATGDGSNALAWVFLMIASLAALGILSWLFFRDRRGRKTKRKKRQNKSGGA